MSSESPVDSRVNLNIFSLLLNLNPVRNGSFEIDLVFTALFSLMFSNSDLEKDIAATDSKA